MNQLALTTLIGQAAKQLAQKGDLVYEYNPFKTFRINTDGDSELRGEPKGSLLDLDTQELGFDLKHPVDIAIQPSYDGSVNLILNDNLNQPRLINSRFSVTGMGTYQIVDREGDNDTNIYDKESFDTDISLYKKASSIAKLRFVGLSSGGNLKVGNYNFYFKLADSDGNETDFIAESGVVTCHIGNVNEPSSIQGGIRDQSSYKAVHFVLSNLDASYNNVVVYYTRSSSDNLNNSETTAVKILKNYPIYSKRADLVINGYEDTLDVSINEINEQYNLVESSRTQDIAQNMLFMGNVNKLEIPYKELADLSLRFYPTVIQNDNIGYVDQNYKDSSGKYEYYNVDNIYYKLGYWNDEIYRFGVVYIMKDYTLSPVFNVRGTQSIGTTSTTYTFDNDTDKVYTANNSRIYIPIDKQYYAINTTDNSKGVVRINCDEPQITQSGVKPYGIKMKMYDRDNLISELKKYTIGCFFVRQKRIETTLCQGVTIGVETVSHLPTIPFGAGASTAGSSSCKYIMESFLSKDRILSHNFGDRKIELSNNTVVNQATAAICPEYELNYPFFNQFFTGSQFTIKTSINGLGQRYCNSNGTHFYNFTHQKNTTDQTEEFRIVSLQDGQALAKNKDQMYSALAGTAEEAFRVSYCKYRNPSKNATNLLRGIYGPYLGLEGPIGLTNEMSVIDIKIPNYSEGNMDEYFQIRYQDSSAFMPISDRMEWNDVKESNIYYRGDCFIGNFTHRMVRNFADPTAPYNEEIVDPNCWADNMALDDADTYDKVNRGDVNAVRMGHWITVKVCSNLNISMRSVDHSWASEEGITNRPRSFYPLYAMNTSGECKIPESNVYNDGYSHTLSTKYNYEMPDVPAIKNSFITRIMYSNIAINDSFRNGFRVFQLMNYRDYTLTYGALTRLVELKGSLIAVFEHGVCLIPVNERAVAGRGAGGNVFINTSNVLPDNPKVITDMYGSQWSESVVKTPNYIYGLDTVAKKIWRTDGNSLQVLSDFKVQKFLIDNISLTETECWPIIGIRNVKTHYNAYKGDVMFTFYDDINTIEEKVWNLCWNEVTNSFTTFYSWVPSYSANIDNIMFTFDRNTSKIITKLTSQYPQLALEPVPAEEGKHVLGKLKLNIDTPSDYTFELYNDNQNNQERYSVENGKLYVNDTAYNALDYWTAAIKATKVTTNNISQEQNAVYIGSVIYGTVTACKPAYKTGLTTSFWKHGQAGLMKHKDIKPCFWYGKQHPFEFEFVVLDNPQTHKIFNNLEIISNKAQPESFHYEIVGEVYDFAKDKLNMYCRQEATRQLYQALGSNIKFNRNYQTLNPQQEKIIGSNYYYKSTIFPLYYQRIETLDEIYNSYTLMQSNGHTVETPPRDYQHLSGSELIYDPQLDEFRISTHIKCCPLNGYYDKEITQDEYNYIVAHFNPVFRKAFAWQSDDGTKYYERIFYGRIKGNSEYKEDKWYIQIPSITFMQKNETKWNKPPIIIDAIPSDIQRSQITQSVLPEGYTMDDVSVIPNVNNIGDQLLGGWTNRKETKIRDKYMKVRIRYTGNDLAVITAIKTIYTESYA